MLFNWSVELRYLPLTWSNDSQSLFFYDDLSVSSRQYRIMQMRPGGTEGYHSGVDFVGPDGSLYYTINHCGGRRPEDIPGPFPIVRWSGARGAGGFSDSRGDLARALRSH